MQSEDVGFGGLMFGGAVFDGVVFDIDGVLRLATPRRQLRRLRALLRHSTHDLRSVQGMPQVVHSLVDDRPGTPVFYLTALPSGLSRLVTGLLRRDGYPPGTALVVGRTPVLRWLVGGGAANKRVALERLAQRMPSVRWVLVGDDAGHDPAVYGEFAERHPGRVAAIAVRQVLDVDPPETGVTSLPGTVAGAPVIAAPNGEELLPRLRTGLGAEPRRNGLSDWFLTGEERGNDVTRLRAWTEGNTVGALVHGDRYLPRLAGTVAATGAGDAVLFAGWRADAGQRLAEHGPTVAEALCGAARRDVRVRGLLWRSHSGLLGYHARENRRVADAVADAGGAVLLDQRVRVLGSHHQKLVAVRHRDRPEDDVAFVGGIDVDLGSRDDARHTGDPQAERSGSEYGPHPAVHDVQLELRGPAVRDVEQVLRERWEDPSPLSGMPWHPVSALGTARHRADTRFPGAAADPPATGGCAVQLLCTYPNRWPRHPSAPRGERSIARGYSKALGRAERIVYVEDQYMWSVDVARVFAAALRRSPRLHLIAVVPRMPDVTSRAYLDTAGLGHAEALAIVQQAGGDRVQVLDVENRRNAPVYVHAKLCIVDDVWAAVGSDNFNMRSWTYDTELAAAVVDTERDPRAPADPAGHGDGARRFARDLRLELMREHLELGRSDSGADYHGADCDGADCHGADCHGADCHHDADLLDPDRAAATVRESAAALEAWHAGGCRGPRPPGRLRPHTRRQTGLPRRHRWFTAPVYRSFLDPDGRPLGMRLRRTY
ncbi:PLD-like domain-containing protein [Pseudonocardia ammonioxydans]|uniref:PLD-like domain-containing protein n=1 Tax=Pseudonocardia ammonioxydans TaxID=260086 RepID=A0A1I5E1G7_PSUAM|nr:PLD-like domain-containing protein [Pseudonocardia ammonioxydans]